MGRKLKYRLDSARPNLSFAREGIIIYPKPMQRVYACLGMKGRKA
jgi:hypothetical protein